MSRRMLALLALLTTPLLARAADGPGAFVGSWTIASAKLAPWADAAAAKDTAERDRLVGQTVTFEAVRIVGPKPLACAKPHYATKTYTPDMLFQGGFTDPGTQAPAFGFTAKTIPTLETGCANELEFHLADQSTLAFALNDYVFTLTRKSAAAK